MKSMSSKSKQLLPVAVNLCRVLLGLVFLFSGTVKAIDPVGTQIKILDYLNSFSLDGLLPDGTVLLLSCLLAGFEILLGAYMLMGVFRRGTSLLVLLFMCVVTPFTLYVAIANPVQDCGCFGDALILTNWQTFAKNIVLLALAVFVRVRNGCVRPLVRGSRQWVVTLVVLAISVRFMVQNVNTLPAIDFRPYSIGTDLRAEVLERHNQKMTDFVMFDRDLYDVTDSILMDSGYVFLMVSPYLEDASWSNLDLIDDLSEYCDRYGYRMVCLTASGREEMREWAANTAADYDFLNCDAVPLKTLVRSNPGLVLLKDGVIANKWSHMEIPQDSQLTAPLEQLPDILHRPYDPFRTAGGVMLLFVLPLVVIALIEKLEKLIH
ncbi:MAG: DoxX family protein [Bacteroidaceae bacterium]|nr:DoxX family protein [Bacteroidaceae bacterium]